VNALSVKLREHFCRYAIFRRDLLPSPPPELEKPVGATQTNEGITAKERQQTLKPIAGSRAIYRITTANRALIDSDLVASTHSRLRRVRQREIIKNLRRSSFKWREITKDHMREEKIVNFGLRI